MFGERWNSGESWNNFATGEIDDGPTKDEEYVNYLPQLSPILNLYKAHVLSGKTALDAYTYTMDYLTKTIEQVINVW